MRTRPLRDEIRNRVRGDLLKGRLAPGEQIRVAQLAERLSVSMTPAREALTQLETEGWVVLHPNRGFFAAPMTVAEAEALYPVLGGLESLAVELQDIPDPNLSRALRALNSKMATTEAAAAAFDWDRRWHEELTKACANPLLLEPLRSLRERAERYERAYMRHSGRVPTSTEHHDRIAAALEREPEQLPGLIREHWQLSVDFIRQWLREQEEGPHDS